MNDPFEMLGVERRYDLEGTYALTNGPWLGIGGYTNIAGDERIVKYTNNYGMSIFYRAKARLQ